MLNSCKKPKGIFQLGPSNVFVQSPPKRSLALHWKAALSFLQLPYWALQFSHEFLHECSIFFSYNVSVCAHRGFLVGLMTCQTERIMVTGQEVRAAPTATWRRKRRSPKRRRREKLNSERKTMMRTTMMTMMETWRFSLRNALLCSISHENKWITVSHVTPGTKVIQSADARVGSWRCAVCLLRGRL